MLGSGCCTNALPPLQMAVVSLLDSFSAAHYSRHTFEGQGLIEKPLCIVSCCVVWLQFLLQKTQSRKLRGHWGVAERLARACCCCEVVHRAAVAHAACLRSICCKCKCPSIWQHQHKPAHCRHSFVAIFIPCHNACDVLLCRRAPLAFAFTCFHAFLCRCLVSS